MPKVLTPSEIRHRLQQLRNLQHLHAKAMARITVLLTTISSLKQQLTVRDQRIAELEDQVADKELQRKVLAAKIFKAKHAKHTTEATVADADNAANPTVSAGQTQDDTVNQPEPSATPLKRRPGKQPGAPAFRRPIPDQSTITEEHVISPARCPNCRGELCGTNEAQTVTRYQEDIDLVPRKIVRQYHIAKRWCGACEAYMRVRDLPEAASRRIGPNVMAYVLYARYRLRLPYHLIQESLDDLHSFRISEGEIDNQLASAKDLFKDEYELICELVKTAKVVYADETGWRMDGDNWYLWVFVTSQGIRYELTDNRGGGVATKALGTSNKDRVIVSDGYSIYSSQTGDNQQCWVHLLRVAKAASQPLYEALATLYGKLLRELGKPVAERDSIPFAEGLTKLASSIRHYPKLTTEELGLSSDKRQTLTAQAKLSTQKVQTRIANHHDQLLTCLQYEDVLPENNTAERAIRPHVIMRKIFGGSRSKDGAENHAVNTSVIATKRQQHPDQSFFEVMVPLLSKDES